MLCQGQTCDRPEPCNTLAGFQSGKLPQVWLTLLQTSAAEVEEAKLKLQQAQAAAEAGAHIMTAANTASTHAHAA